MSMPGGGEEGAGDLLGLLESSRRREKEQTLYYRALAARAEEIGRPDDSERLNGLHADEQHHLSRLTARVLELGAHPADLRDVRRPEPEFEAWEDAARQRESEEVRWYQNVLDENGLDGETRRVIEEILDSERRHREALGGKWMSA